MSDFLAYDLVEAFALRGCPICRTVADDEDRWLASFWREGRSGRDARLAFYAGAGFCRRHAWLLHRSVGKAGAPIADLYGALAERDLDRLGRTTDSRRKGRLGIGPAAACSACTAAADTLSRKTYFLLELLRTDAGREAYRASDGLCRPHLAGAVDQARDEPGLVPFLLDDWRRRLARVRALLADYDRKRDVRHADEPKGDEQDSWTEIIRMYAGERP